MASNIIVPDTNILIYAFSQASSYHAESLAWWEEAVNSSALICVPQIVYFGFIRIMTNRKIIASPMTSEEAIKTAGAWFDQPNVKLLQFNSQTDEIFRSLTIKYQLCGNMITDAIIAASALENGGVLYSNDTDFARFSELQVINPIKMQIK